MPIKDLQKYLKEHANLIFGEKQVVGQIKYDKIKEVFLAADCYKKIEEKILHYSKFSKIVIDKLPANKEEISLICKKKFPISIIGVSE